MHLKRVSSHEEKLFRLPFQDVSGTLFFLFADIYFFWSSVNTKESYIAQLVIAAIITMTVFIRTRMDIDIIHGNSYMSCLFFATVVLLVDGIPELSMTVQRLSVFYKQKQLCFYPAWAYAIPATVLKIPLSFFESLVWTCLTYYVIGYTPEPYR